MRVPIAAGQFLHVWSNKPIGLRELDVAARYLELYRWSMVEDGLRDWLKVAPPSFIDDEALP